MDPPVLLQTLLKRAENDPKGAKREWRFQLTWGKTDILCPIENITACVIQPRHGPLWLLIAQN